MRTLSWTPLLLLVAACSSNAAAPLGATYELTGRGTSSAPARVSDPNVQAASTAVGTPTGVRLQISGVYLSTSSACTSPVTVQTYSSPQAKDLIGNPVLATGEPAAGTYNCLILETSDSISYTSGVTSGNCTAGTSYAMDIYRADNTGSELWKDHTGASITPIGTDSTIGAQRVALVFTADTAAAFAAGWGHGQVIPLSGTVVSPGSNTFVWDFTNTLTSDTYTSQGGATVNSCGLEPPLPRVQ